MGSVQVHGCSCESSWWRQSLAYSTASTDKRANDKQPAQAQIMIPERGDCCVAANQKRSASISDEASELHHVQEALLLQGPVMVDGFPVDWPF